MIGQLSTIVIDCPEPLALARFYSELLGWPITNQDDDWVDVGDGQPRLAFQLAPDHQPPRWPDPAHPQQFHHDVRVGRRGDRREGGARDRCHPVARRGRGVPGVRGPGRPPVLPDLVSQSPVQ